MVQRREWAGTMFPPTPLRMVWFLHPPYAANGAARSKILKLFCWFQSCGW